MKGILRQSRSTTKRTSMLTKQVLVADNILSQGQEQSPHIVIRESAHLATEEDEVVKRDLGDLGGDGGGP
jgi:hypothetical protein